MGAGVGQTHYGDADAEFASHSPYISLGTSAPGDLILFSFRTLVHNDIERSVNHGASLPVLFVSRYLFIPEYENRHRVRGAEAPDPVGSSNQVRRFDVSICEGLLQPVGVDQVLDVADGVVVWSAEIMEIST